MKIDFSQIPHTSKIFLDYINSYSKVSSFYHINPHRDQDFFPFFKELSQRKYQRETITHILIEQNKFFGNHPTTISSIERLKNPNTFVVFTGQQIGIFTGALYTIYKAMTAINIARYLTLTTPYTFIPIFWAETEDHDFKEVQTTYIIDKFHRLTPLTYHGQHPPKIPVGRIILDESIEEVIEKYVQNTTDTEFKGEVVSLLKECYQKGSTLSYAFCKLMVKLLGRYGLVVLDPSHHKIKELSHPIYEKALIYHEEIKSKLEKTNHLLKEKGYHTQVKPRKNTLDFFYHSPQRVPITFENEIKIQNKQFTPQKFREFLKENITKFSPNVILRPQIQDFVFPTAVYVAGPSELAYFGQFKKIYQIFNTPMPIIYPRKSVTVLEKSISKIMEKYGISVEEIFKNQEEIRKRILKENMPDELKTKLNKSKAEILNKIDELEVEAEKFNPSLKPAIKKLKGKIIREFSHTETKISKEIEKQDQIITRQIEKLFVHLYPENHLQERRLNIFSFYHKYFRPFVYCLMEITCCRHDYHHIVWKVHI